MTQRSQRKNIFVTGDANLVQEFAELCAKTYFVYTMARLPQTKGSKKPEDFRTVTGIPKGISLAAELTNIDFDKKKKNLQSLDRELPSTVPVLTSSVTSTVTEQATWIRHPERLIGFCALPTFLKNELIEIAPSVHTSEMTISKTKEFLWSLGREISVVQDRVGMVLPRIVCLLVNEAAFAIMESVASPEEIDLAMELGTNYPRGPIKMGSQIGFDQVAGVLEALHKDLGEDRYRVAPLLKQLALTRGFWKTEKPS